MCGIIGYSGPNKPLPILIGGLSRLEYRGYDSAGIAISDGETLTIEKKEGKLDVLKKHLEDKGILSEGIIDNYKPTDLEEIEIKKRRDEYVSSILRPLVKELLEPDQGRKIKE